MHDRQNATVVRFLLREELANYQSDGAAVVRRDRQLRRRSQKSEEEGERSKFRLVSCFEMRSHSDQIQKSFCGCEHLLQHACHLFD
jgi:2-polyprenyl-3-methyl-5-hydroxy-6-metoxy-1,4-benzoquinol methylase